MSGARIKSVPIWELIVGGLVVALVVIILLNQGFGLPLGGSWRMEPTPNSTVAAQPTLTHTIVPEPDITSTVTPRPSPKPGVRRVGIVAGHMGRDSGAICPDGLQEVDINRAIATRVVERLNQDLDWQADLLEEFDEKLNDYSADALLSIHADSCNVPGRSGFKVARVESSYSSETEDQLIDCVSQHYHEATDLTFDRYTITYDMTRYHAYYEIDPSTPAVVIEVGFMLEDRELLTEQSDLVVEGIVNGLICFIEGEAAIP
jgi:N-acetylmuramoyl-L-alanine amidase